VKLVRNRLVVNLLASSQTKGLSEEG